MVDKFEIVRLVSFEMKVKATKIFAIIFVLHLKVPTHCSENTNSKTRFHLIFNSLFLQVFNAAPPNPFIMVRRDAVVRCGSKNNDESPLKKYLHKGVLSGNDEMGTPRCYKVRKSLCKRVPRYSLIFSCTYTQWFTRTYFHSKFLISFFIFDP